jgi:hypothetical protein
LQKGVTCFNIASTFWGVAERKGFRFWYEKAEVRILLPQKFFALFFKEHSSAWQSFGFLIRLP